MLHSQSHETCILYARLFYKDATIPDASQSLPPKSFSISSLDACLPPTSALYTSTTTEGSGVSSSLERTFPNIVSVFAPFNVSNMVSKSWVGRELYRSWKRSSGEVSAIVVAASAGSLSKNISS
eukprot:Gb_33386 [translate_table: standard]